MAAAASSSSSSSLALKRFLSSNILRLRQLAPPASSRLFNTAFYDDDDDGEDHHVDRRTYRPVPRRDLLSDAYEQLGPRRLGQILNMMDQLVDTPIGPGQGWGARETEDGLCLRMDMPGLGKEDVKVSVEHNTLVIRGEGPKEFEDDDDDESARKYECRIDLPEKMYKMNEIKAEMKNGVLKLLLPKVKDEDRTDVFHVKVE